VRIISGGQTGIDRAALDVALKLGIDCGGWCPEGRLDEFREIPIRYPVTELPGGPFADRTRQNVKDADGTVIFYCKELRGGSAFTQECSAQLARPCCLIDGALMSDEKAAEKIRAFVAANKIQVLNIAGPRQSEWPAGYGYATSAIEAALLRNL
jgi:hypothetical protein